MSLRILYLSVNSSFSHSSPAYGQLRAFSEENYKEAMDWKFVECSINDSFDETIHRILDFNPNLILSTAYLFNIEFILKLLSRVFLLQSDTLIALGGPEFLGENESFLRQNRFISAVFRGDESPLPCFLAVLRDSAKWHSLQGICYLDNDLYVDKGTAKIPYPLDELPSPYERGYFSSDKPFVHFETSRGCPSLCLFCSSANSKPSFYCLKRIDSDLSIIRKAGIKEIRILDRTFNIPEERALLILELFITKYSDMKFHIEVDPSNLTQKVFEELKKAPAGMFHIEAGIQTFSTTVLKAIKRKANIEQIISNIAQLCAMQNTRVHTDLIAGLPLQTFSNIIEDIKILTKFNPAEIQLENLKLLPGSPLRKKELFCAKYSLFPPYEILETKDISFYELLKLKTISRIIDIYHNIENFKILFNFTVLTDKNFLEDFAEISSEALMRKEKPSVETRLSMIYEYASKKQNKPLYELTLYTSFMLGIIPRKFAELKTLKFNEIEKLKRKIIWDKGNKLSFDHAFLCSFEYAPFELITNPARSARQNPASYIFYYPTLSFSKTLSHIEEIL